MAGSESRVAIVLPGGGARGAYEAGALSVLLPALEARGERVSIVTGTSVGAINAALLASMAHLPAAEQAEGFLERWRSMRKRDVIRPVVGPGLALTALRFLGEALEVPGVQLGSVLDPAPLRDSIDRWIDWTALARNVRDRTVESVCVVATSLSHGGPVAFVHSRGATPPGRDRVLPYVRTPIGAEHVRASAAIPVLFAPVEVTTPRSARGHYIDGGVRLNAPLKPALGLGADRVIVLGFEPFSRQAQQLGPRQAPKIADVAANVLDGLLVDQVADDVHRMVAINAFFADGPSRSAYAYRAARGRAPYRKVAYALVAPEHRGELGAIAERIFAARYGGLKGLMHPDYPFLSRVLGGRGRSRGELLSFLMFDELFTEELIGLGRRDADRWLERHPRFWCSDGAHDLGYATADAVREDAALDEFRSLRRR